VRFPRATRLLACFQYRDDAEAFHNQLPHRLTKFGLRLAEEKTQCIRFGRYARDDAHRRGGKPKEFTFLGFTHYCGKTKRGDFKVKRRTSRKKFGQSLNRFAVWARKSRGVLTKSEMLRRAKARVVGHLNYYAITDNADRCSSYVHHATRVLFKWLNRKSQRRTYTWVGYRQALDAVGWPQPTIRKDLNQFRRLQAT
jgi:hypothetical protein